jgi:hypothetical protein
LHPSLSSSLSPCFPAYQCLPVNRLSFSLSLSRARALSLSLSLARSLCRMELCVCVCDRVRGQVRDGRADGEVFAQSLANCLRPRASC